MPSRNIKKEQAPDSYYHIYARGNNKQKIFLESIDFKYFLKLFDRYLSANQAISKTGAIYPNYNGEIEVLAYCIMPNHFHLLIYQVNVPFLEKFMRSLMTSYSKYLNLKYKRTGPVFESRYRAVRIDNSTYLQYITRYIHLNPRRWEDYRHSSLRSYKLGNEPCWLHTSKILDLFKSRQSYMDFVSNYEEMHEMLDDLKYQLANK